MDTIIDLGREVVIDRSKIRDPYFRLWLAAVGEPLAAGSPWVAVSKPRLPGRLCKEPPMATQVKNMRPVLTLRVSGRDYM